MIGADIQTTGLVALAGAVAGVIVAVSKGVWEVFSSARKMKREARVDADSRSLVLSDSAREGIMALNGVLNADNDRLRADLLKAEMKIVDLQASVDSLRVENATQRDTITDLTHRLERLERRDAN